LCRLGPWRDGKQSAFKSKFGISLGHVGLHNLDNSDAPISIAEQKRLAVPTVGDSLDLTCGEGVEKGICFDNRGQIFRDSMELGALSPPKAWFNDYDQQSGTQGRSGTNKRRAIVQVKEKGKGVVTITASPTAAVLKQQFQKVKDDGYLVRDNVKYNWVNGLSIASPLCRVKQRKVAVIPSDGGEVVYKEVEVLQQAVLNPLSTTIAAKLADWHRKYGFQAKSLAMYREMQVGELVELLLETNYCVGHKVDSPRRGEKFDFTESVEEDRNELAGLVYREYSTLSLCLWGDNADLASHDHAAFLWHVVFYDWQWENAGAFNIVERPNLHMTTRSVLTACQSLSALHV
jgi:hypothetical protein